MKRLPSTVKIRPATRPDLPAIVRLARIKELAAPNRQGAERWWIRDHLLSKQMLFVAESQRQIVGFVMGECATGRVAILHLLAVHHDFRKTRVAASLGQAFQRECRQRHMTCILTYASSRHPFLATVLKKHGFSPGSQVQEFQKFL